MSPANPKTLEVCIDTAAGLAACQGRADRVELCSALSVGGLTPSPGLIEMAQHSTVPCHAMIRPRVGDFDFDPSDIETCCNDISQVREFGLAGVVLGASGDGRLNLDALRVMREAAGPLECTLHRVIDLMDDPGRAVEQAIDLGFARILTSGGTRSAVDGLARLKQMNDIANGRIEIMVGSGVSAANILQIATATGIRSYHASCSRAVPQGDAAQKLGFADRTRNVTDPDLITDLRRAIERIAG